MRPADRERDRLIAERINAELDREQHEADREEHRRDWARAQPIFAAIDRDLEAAVREANTLERATAFLAVLAEERSKPEAVAERLCAAPTPDRADEQAVAASLGRLRGGEGTAYDQRLAAALIEVLRRPSAPLRRGPKPVPEVERNRDLYVAVHTARRIKRLARKLPGQSVKADEGAYLASMWTIGLDRLPDDKKASEDHLQAIRKLGRQALARLRKGRSRKANV